MKWTITRLVLSTALTTKPRAEAFRLLYYHSFAVSARNWNKEVRHDIKTRCDVTALRGGADSSSSPLPHIPLPPSFNERYEDVNTALLAVFASSRVTRHVQPNTSNGIAAIAKSDASPVTIGDFASQATTLKVLHTRFPSDMFIAEEGSDVLRKDKGLLSKVWDAVKIASSDITNICSWSDTEQLLRSIDYGQGIDPEGVNEVEPKSSRRVWCLDPIDGTKGFLRGRNEGGQYCIALALLEDGVPVVSILGCPNQPVSSNKLIQSDSTYGVWSDEEIAEAESQSNDINSNIIFSSNRGCFFVAVRDCGCYEISIHDLELILFGSKDANDATMWKQLQVTSHKKSPLKTPSQATFCLGVERSFSDPKGTVLKVAQLLHGEGALTTDDVPDIVNSFRMDGQGKYGILARGEAEYFLRLPKPGYVDWVWDVAAGHLILTEAGGLMTDVSGNHIDFSGIGYDRMAKLPTSVEGLLGSCGGAFHEALVDAYASIEKST